MQHGRRNLLCRAVGDLEDSRERLAEVKSRFADLQQLARNPEFGLGPEVAIVCKFLQEDVDHLDSYVRRVLVVAERARGRLDESA